MVSALLGFTYLFSQGRINVLNSEAEYKIKHKLSPLFAIISTDNSIQISNIGSNSDDNTASSFWKFSV